jgi:hypothetical protein
LDVPRRQARDHAEDGAENDMTYERDHRFPGASEKEADAEAAYEMGPTSRGRKLTTPPRRRQPFAVPMCSQPSKR